MVIDFVPGRSTTFVGRMVRNDLMAEEIEIDPMTRILAPLWALKNRAVETSRGVQIIDGKGKVETGPGLKGLRHIG